MPRRLKLRRLDRIAEKEGFGSLCEMMADLYVNRNMGIAAIADHLLTSVTTVYAVLERCKIVPRPVGGVRNDLLIEITMDLVNECARDGIPAVAARLAVDYTLLRTRLLQWLEKQKKP
jgi:hypothetical protein